MALKSVFLMVLLTALFGCAVGFYIHPHEQCSRKYQSPEDISECVWIKTHE